MGNSVMKNLRFIKKTSFTLIELMMIVVILGILFTILLPQLARSKEHAQVVICMSNLRQVALGYQNYMHDFEGALPEREYWLDDFAATYMHTRKKDEVFTCPNTKKPPSSVWDEEGNLRNGDFLTGGTVEDVEKNHNLNNGKGNNPYHFDPSNPSPKTRAVMASKRSDRIVYEKFNYYKYSTLLPIYMDSKVPERKAIHEIKEKIYVSIVGGFTRSIKHSILKFFTEKGIEIYIHEKIMVLMNDTDFRTSDKFKEPFRDLNPTKLNTLIQ